MKKILVYGLLVASFLAQFSIANAFTLASAETIRNAVPGGSYTVDVSIIPRDHEIGKDLLYTIDITGVQFGENGKKQALDGEATKNEPYYSVAKWIDTQHQEKVLNDQEGAVFTVAVDIPEDIAPGTYYFNIAGAANDVSKMDNTGSQVGFVAIINQIITVDIAGEIDEDMELVSFGINEQKYENGNVEFEAEFKNNSVVELMPTGTIKIYDQSGEQVTGIVLETETLPDGSKVLLDKQDELKFNTTGLSVEPSNSKKIPVQWLNRSIAPGNYEAKLEGYFGKEGSFESSVDFEIKQGITVDAFTADTLWYGSLPVGLTAEIANNGSTVVSPSGTFEVKDMWGNVVHSSVINKFLVGVGETFTLPDLTWDSGFAIGSYTATLTITDEESGITVVKTATFFVASWWQALIILVILVVVIFGVVKMVKKYSDMKKKLGKMEHDSKEEEKKE